MRVVSLRQKAEVEKSDELGYVVPVGCDGCKSIITLVYPTKENQDPYLIPPPKVDGVEDLPDPINKYYEEALDCISADAPNGATTLFRKTIHAVAIHYDIAEIDDSMSIYKMIENLDKEGQINNKLRESLLAVKDIGNDGAHINENEPDIEQALAIKELIDAVLHSTVVTDQRINFAREKHPNEFAKSENEE
ncbi:DUF4145 domain-containing protein [Saliphagus infecundisoli]|nr:DUF4145 domain-containing protein [Saliphagus infecundisoli]